MDGKYEDPLLKNFYQNDHFFVENEATPNAAKADRLREMMYFLDKLDSDNNGGHGSLKDDISVRYHRLVDNMDSGSSLDNYSEMITTLTEGTRNESSSWTSGLSWSEASMPASCKIALERSCVAEGRTMKISCSNNSLGIQDSRTNGRTLQESQHNGQKQQQNQHNQQQDDDYLVQPHIPMFGGKRKQTSRDEVSENTPDKRTHPKNILYNRNTNNTTHCNQREATDTVQPQRRQREDNVPNEDCDDDSRKNPFLTAHQQLRIDMKKPGGGGKKSGLGSYGQTKKSLGAKRGGVSGAFVPPIGGQDPLQGGEEKKKKKYEDKDEAKEDYASKYEEFEWMKNVDAKMIEHVENEIMDQGEKVTWDDIAGLEFAKNTIQEIVIWPMLRPDLFTGLRGPPKGLLLFGPPGTGKTLIGKCIASQSNAKFFNISASSLTSKWIGDGEKMVRALFGVARCVQPAVIFIDEIDSLLTQRSESEHESSRRLKTEFLVQLDGATALLQDRILVVGATNRPQELDEAARRRLVKRLYIPLPDAGARKHLILNLMKSQNNDLSPEHIEQIVLKSDGFSGADMANLCRDAALGPIRGIRNIQDITASDVRPVSMEDFVNALTHVRPSVSQNDLQVYVDWNRTYGSGGT